MRAEVSTYLEEAAGDPTVRGLVFTGAGDAFSSGQDFNEVPEWAPETPWVAEIKELYRQIIDFPKPTVAAVNGVAAGSGMQLALLCDYRVAVRHARLGQTEIKWGLASIVGTWLLAQVVGAQRARAMALTGELVDASRALSDGLIDEIVADDEIMTAAVARAEQMASYEPETFIVTKKWAARQFMTPLWDVYDQASTVHAEVFEQGASHRGAEKFLGRHV